MAKPDFTFGLPLADNPSAPLWEVHIDDKLGVGYAADEGDALRLARLSAGVEHVRNQTVKRLTTQEASPAAQADALDQLAKLQPNVAQTASQQSLGHLDGTLEDDSMDGELLPPEAKDTKEQAGKLRADLDKSSQEEEGSDDKLKAPEASDNVPALTPEEQAKAILKKKPLATDAEVSAELKQAGVKLSAAAVKKLRAAK